MATYKVRGNSHNVIYQYRTSTGQVKQLWESYETKLEAIQRKAYIDHLQAQKRTEELRQVALEYRRSRAIEKAATKIGRENADISEPIISEDPDENLLKTYREFMERFLPAYARKKISPLKPTTAM